MNSSTVVGYTYQGDLYCYACADLDVDLDDDMLPAPIFACAEYDHAIHCSECGKKIDVSIV